MRPVSSRYLSTVRGPHDMAVEARVCTTFQTGVDPTGVEIEVGGGQVVCDANSDIRSTLDLTTTGVGGMWPSSSNTLLAPYGNEVFARRGIRYGAGSVEWVSLGYFRIEAPDQDDVPIGAIRLTGKDRMAGIIDARLLAPVQFDSATTRGAVVNQLVHEVYPGAVIEWDSGDGEALGRSVIEQQDRFKLLDDLARSAAKMWFWDHRGVLVFRDLPDPGVPVWDVDYGENGVLVEMSRSLSREGVYNAVVATGEAADTAPPARGVAFDNNPLSPTYFYGRFGPKPKFFTSPFMTTDQQAQRAAEAELRRSLGLPYQVDFQAVPNCALEPLDPVRVIYPPGQVEAHVLNRVTIPLTPEAALTATTKEQTVTIVGQM